MDLPAYIRRRYWKAKGILGNVIRSLYPPIYMTVHEKESFIDGISANVVTKDDIWLKESLYSIKDYVHEIVIIDSSSTKYREKNNDIINELKREIEVKYIWKDLNITEARNLAQSLSTRSYILRWDGDMIAYTEGIESIERIFKMLNEFEYKKYYYEIFFQLIRMGYSLMTITDKDTRYHREAWLYSNSKNMKWISKSLPLSLNARKIEQPLFPSYYKKKIVNEPFGLHLHLIQPKEKLIVKALYGFWMNPSIREKFTSYEEFYKIYSNRISNDLIFEVKEIWAENIKIPSLLRECQGKTYNEIMKIKSREYPWIYDGIK